MSDPNDAILRQRIVDFLRSNSCQRIDFTWGPYHIDGWCYLRVAMAVQSPLHDFHVLVGEQNILQGASAAYSSRTNTLKVPRVTYATPSDVNVSHSLLGLAPSVVLGFQRMSIVHECTHAAIDQLNHQHPTIFRRSNEVIAYVAAALFNIYEGSPYDASLLPSAHPARPSFVAADAAARAIANRPGASIGGSTAALEQALSATQLYHRAFLDDPLVANSGLRF